MRFLLTLGILLQGYFVVLSSQAAGAPACDANQCASFFYLATCKFPNSAKDSQYLYQQTVVGASPCDTEYTKKYCKCGPLVDPQATSGGGGATSGGGDASGGGATGGGTSSGGNSASGGGTTGGTGTSGSPTTSPNAGKVGPVQYCNSNENVRQFPCYPHYQNPSIFQSPTPQNPSCPSLFRHITKPSLSSPNPLIHPPPKKNPSNLTPPPPPLKTALRPNAAMRQMHPRRHPLGARRPHLRLRRPERRAGRRFLRRRVRVRLCARRGGWGDWGNRRGLIEIVDWGGGLERMGTGKFGGGSGRENGVSLMLVIGWLVRTYDPFTYLSILSILLSPISHIPRSFIRFHKI